MSYKVVLLPEANKDLRSSIKWYNKQKPGLGKSFYQEVKSRINYIQSTPLHYPIVYRETRHAIVNRFPFRVHFKVSEVNNEIVIFGIVHTSREPLKWQDRVQ